MAVAGAGPDKPSSYAAATRRLLELGHRRIVLIARTARRLPTPGLTEQAFLSELRAVGVHTGPFNLPAWEESVGGFHQCVDSLFAKTPPTALVVDEAPLFIAALQHLNGRGLRVPEDVSMVCTDADAAFEWCHPSIAHIAWDSAPVVRRAVRWAKHVGLGKRDLTQTLTRSEFIEGGTIGPVKEK